MCGCADIFGALGYSPTPGAEPNFLSTTLGHITADGGVTTVGIILLNLYRNWTRAKALKVK